MRQTKGMGFRAGAIVTTAAVAAFLAPTPAHAATYTVFWSSSSSPYAYDFAYTGLNCTGTAVKIDDSRPSATGRRSLRSPTYTDFTWGHTRPATTRITYNTCFDMPDSGSWYGYDPAR